MAFDPSVISSIPDTTGNPVKAKEDAYTLSNMMDTNTLNKMKLSDAKQQQAEEELYKSILKGSDLSTDEGASKAAEKLTHAGLPEQSMRFMKERQAIKSGALDIEAKKWENAMSQQEALVGAVDGVIRQVDQYKKANPTATPAMMDAKTLELVVPAMDQLAQQRQDLAPVIAKYKTSTPGALTYQGLLSLESSNKSGLARMKERYEEQKGEREERNTSVREQQANTQAVNAATSARREEAYASNVESLKKNRDPELLSEKVLAMAVPTVMADPNRMKDYYGSAASSKKIKDQINGAISDRMTAAGLSIDDLPRIRADTKAESTSIGKLIPQLNAVSAYEKLGKFNGNRLLELIDQLDDTGIPLIEGPARYAKKKAGSADAAEFGSVLTSYQNEVARILNNPNMTGVVHRGAVEDIQHVISGDVSADQAKRLINRINLEMDFRQTSLQQAVNDAGAAMTSPGATPQPGAQPPPAAGSAPPSPGGLPSPAVAAPPTAPVFDPSKPGVGFWKH